MKRESLNGLAVIGLLFCGILALSSAVSSAIKDTAATNAKIPAAKIATAKPGQ